MIEYRDKIKIERIVVTERVEHADGTKTEKKTETERTDQTSKLKDKQRTDTPPPLIAARKPDYSIGIQWTPDWRDPSWQPSGASVGYRMMGDVWSEARFDWQNGELTFGLRYEW